MQAALFPSRIVGYVDSENPWQNETCSSTTWLNVSLLSLTILCSDHHGKKTVFETGVWQPHFPRIQRMRLIKSADEVQKMMVASLYADGLLRLVLIIFLLRQGEYHRSDKREGYEMSFDTMVFDWH